jgi:hypothetical protein
MVVSSLAHLPEPVLEQLLGGMLLTHFRSAHREQADLYLLRGHKLPVGQDVSKKVDWVIYDRTRRCPVGAFELVRTASQFRAKREVLRKLREVSSRQRPPQMRIGLVAPESLAPDLRAWATRNDLEVVSYPA